MRIGQILTSARDGGLEKTVLQTCVGLRSRGHDVSVYALLPDNPGAEDFRAQGIPFRSFGARNRGLTGVVSTAAAIPRLAGRLRRDRIDMVVVHDFFPAFAGRLAARLARVPLEIAVLHSTYEWLGPRARVLDRLLANGTDAFVAVSEAAREARLAWGGYDPAKIRVIHNGIDPGRFHPDPAARERIRAEFGIPSDALLAGSVGVVRESKRQTDLVNALVGAMASRRNLHLLLVGSTRPHEEAYARELERALERLPAERVHRTGNRTDIPAILAALDFYAAPSESEGFGLALVEALLTGLPVVASSIPAHLEIAEGNPAVAFHSPRDPEALGALVARLLDASAQGRPSGRDAVAAAFSEERMIERWSELVQALGKRP